MPVFNNILAGAAGQAGGAAAAGPIKSVRFNDGDSAYLNRTPSSAGNTKTWTFSCWVKRSSKTVANNPALLSAGANSGVTGFLQITFEGDEFSTFMRHSGGTNYAYTNAKLRDYSAWYHLVVAMDTTAATEADRLKMYVNGVEQTFRTSSIPSLNRTFLVNDTALHQIAATKNSGGTTNNFLPGYLADLYLIDGQALDPTSFGAFDDNGVWQAAAYSGTFGTNGFHLFDFANESTVGHDSSGNNNDFTANNISTTAGAGNDVLFDVPLNGTQSDTGAGGEVSGNYCTMNPLANYLTLANGNLDVSQSSAAHHTSYATLGVSSGKWYWEITKNDGNNSASTSIGLGVAKTSFTSDGSAYVSSTDTIIGYLQSGVGLYDGDGYSRLVTALGSGAEHTAGTWMLAFDFDAGKGWIGKDGTWLSDTTAGNEGNPATGANPSFNGFVSGETYVPMVGMYAATSVSANFGQRAFAYSAPSGFKALCTANLPTSDVPDGSDYFDVATWAGNSSTHSSTGLGFQPDFLWYKSLSAYHYGVQDAVRGVGKSLSPSRIDVAEQTETTGLDAFTSDGFDLDGDGFYYINKSGQNFVGWAWNGGGSTVSNTDGTLTSSVRASQTAGTSIVTYTGSGSATSVGHGLNATPDAIIVKNRDTTSLNWAVYHSGLPANESVALNLAWGYTSIADHFDAPSSTVFNIASDDTVNKSGDDFVAYCFSSVEGFSKFGTYVGTGASGSPFVYLGFKPALLIIKKQGSGNWFIHDYKRPGYNQNTGPLRIAAEAELTVTTYDLDILSNGFVMRTTGGDANGSGSDYIYFAWAENPFQNNGGLAR